MDKVRVLVVEDEDLWQDIIREELESYDCQVDVVAKYLEAKQKLDRNVYDVVTLDMALSPAEKNLTVAASSGWRLLVNQLIQNSPGTAIFVISGSFGDQPARAFELNRKYGVKDFMTKGEDFNPTTLRKWVDEVRKFQEAGGRPDSTTEKLLSYYNEQLAILWKNKARLEKQKAKYGIDVPVRILNSIEDTEKDIERAEAEIAKLSS